MITEQWNKYLDMLGPAEKDVYFTEEYHALCAAPADTPRAFVHLRGDKVLVFPFLSRTTTMADGTVVKDFESAYGYGGPVANTTDAAFIDEAMDAMAVECAAAGYIAGFVRFHPLLGNSRLAEKLCAPSFNRHTVAISLAGSEDDMWRGEIHTQNRNVIRKGAREGLVFDADYSFAALGEFRRLYGATMDRLSADGFYYFDDAYFERFRSGVPGSFIGTVRLAGTVIAAAIFMRRGPYGHYHLSGSDAAFLRLSPNNFMLWNAALELKRQGAELFHLGGGTDGAADNSLFRFKQRFSKSLFDFHIGKIVFNRPEYDRVCAAWAAANPEKEAMYGPRLLKYRY